MLRCLLIPSGLHRDCLPVPVAAPPRTRLGRRKGWGDAAEQVGHLRLPLHHCVINHGRINCRCGRWWRRGRHGSRVSAPARALPTDDAKSLPAKPTPPRFLLPIPSNPSQPRQGRCGNTTSRFLSRPHPCVLPSLPLASVSLRLPSGRWAGDPWRGSLQH